MSGIAGTISLDGRPAVGIDAMLHSMRRRGPDRQTAFRSPLACFGQALLATTLEATADVQPWRHPDSGCVVVSDSRLDNRAALLRDLGIRGNPDDIGDGRLLHDAWQRWGPEFADRLRGDFSIAIWRPNDCSLYLARDPMGVRPLAFHHAPGRHFAFASTADDVIAQGEVPRMLNEARIADALITETEGIDQTCTFYRAVERLPPATWLELRDGHVRQTLYWRPIGSQRLALPRNEGEWVDAQRDHLDRAVRRRLRSHRPVGSMLSGGLDSSSVVALACQARTEGKEPAFPVFSATNASDDACPETSAIHAVTRSLHCDATYVDIATANVRSAHESSWWTTVSEPFDGGVNLAASLYRAAQARGVVSLMDGVPADNLYVIGNHAQRMLKAGNVRGAWMAALQRQLPHVRHPRMQSARHLLGGLTPPFVHQVANKATMRRDFRELMRNSLIDREFAERIRLFERYRQYRQTIPDSHQWDPSGLALSSMAAPYITAGLERFNRVASQFGIEPRPPYADRDLIEFHAWVPFALRTRDGHAKWILRQAMRNDLPAAVTWRADKHHLGIQFTRAELVTALHADGGSADLDPGPYIDRSRWNQAVADRGLASVNSVGPALRVLLWNLRHTLPHLPS